MTRARLDVWRRLMTATTTEEACKSAIGEDADDEEGETSLP
jgi:hypothetical protein